MKRMFVGAMILILLFGGVGMATTPPLPTTDTVNTTITILGSADFRLVGDFQNILLAINPFQSNTSNTVQWRILSNLLVEAEFESIGPEGGTGVPAWAHSFFTYSVTGPDSSEPTSFTLKSSDSNLQVGTTKSETIVGALDNGTVLPINGTIVLDYAAPSWDDEGNFNGNSFLGLGSPGTTYNDVVQVTISASTGE